MSEVHWEGKKIAGGNYWCELGMCRLIGIGKILQILYLNLHIYSSHGCIEPGGRSCSER